MSFFVLLYLFIILQPLHCSKKPSGSSSETEGDPGFCVCLINLLQGGKSPREAHPKGAAPPGENPRKPEIQKSEDQKSNSLRVPYGDTLALREQRKP